MLYYFKKHSYSNYFHPFVYILITENTGVCYCIKNKNVNIASIVGKNNKNFFEAGKYYKETSIDSDEWEEF